MKNIPPLWTEKYIGIPFVSGGREIETGLDCYGLFWIIQNTHYGKKLPMLSGNYKDACNHLETMSLFLKHQPLLAGIKIDSPSPGCCVIIRYNGYPLHIGVHVGGGYIIHTLEKTGSFLDHADSLNLKNRIEGYYIVH